MLYNILKIEELPKGITPPVNVTINGNEEVWYISPINISMSNKVCLFEYFMNLMRGKKEERRQLLEDSIITLDEKKFNARMGYAKVKSNGKTNTGHANREVLLDELASEKIILFLQNSTYFNRYKIMNREEIEEASSKFVAFLITFLYNRDGIANDTISDLIFALELPRILDYTNIIFEEMKKQGTECFLTKERAIRHKEHNLILIPENWMTKDEFKSRYETYVEDTYGGMHTMMLMSRFKAITFKMHENNQITKQLRTKALNITLNFDWSKVMKKEFKVVYKMFLGTISGGKTIGLFQDERIINAIKEWFYNYSKNN